MKKQCTKCLRLKSVDDFYHKWSENRLFSRCKSCERLISIKYYSKHSEVRKSWSMKDKLKYRALIFNHYGSECKCCGEKNEVFLCLDHISGGGNKHRREVFGHKRTGGTMMYRWVVKNNFPIEFQILCHNFNWSKAHGGCPHQLAGGGYDL